MFKILIVEDDAGISKVLSGQISKWGYDVKAIEDEKFDDILNEFIRYNPHLVLMDINLPCFDGFYWCKKIRDVSKVPIIFISSRDANMDIIMAMNMGGDDFVQKPFSTEVLVAKMQAILRRTYDYKEQENMIIKYKEVILDLNKHIVQYKDKEIELTKNEFKIFHILMKYQGKIIDKTFIIKQLWKDETFINENALAVNINRLRNKLKEIELEDFIQTKVGQGYVIL